MDQYPAYVSMQDWVDKWRLTKYREDQGKPRKEFGSETGELSLVPKLGGSYINFGCTTNLDIEVQ